MPVSRHEFEWSHAASLRVLRWPLLDATGVVDAVVTTRSGGVSAGVYESLNLGLHVGDNPSSVVENRTRAARAVGLELEDMVFCNQTHSSTAAVVGYPQRGRGTRSEADAIPSTDALVTADADVGLVIMVADCVPIVLVDPVARVLACVHSGWRGATSRIAAVAVEKMVDLGAIRERILAAMGPAISADRYQVGEDVFAAATDAFGSHANDVIWPDGTGRWNFDGWQANAIVLEQSGVLTDHVAVAEAPTGQGEFFSDRAERPCGRFAALARLRVPELRDGARQN